MASRAPWAAHFGLARTPFGKSIAGQGPVRPPGPRPGDRPDQLLHRRDPARRHHRRCRRRARPSPLRAAVAGLDPTRHQVIYVANPAFGTSGLYVQVVRALGARPRYLKAELMAQAADLLAAETAERHRTVVLIVDEAHLLQPDQLEELRLMTNAEMDSASPFAGILIGQPTLARQLRMGMFAALDQRIATRYAIKPMDLAESAAYLRHHMTLAGREEPLFADDAVARLHRVSYGLPRALNNAATAALIAAAAAGTGPRRRCLRQESSRRTHPRLTASPPAGPDPRPGTALVAGRLPSRAPGCRARAAGSRPAGPARRQLPRPARRRPASQRSTRCCSKPSTRSPASSPATTTATA